MQKVTLDFETYYGPEYTLKSLPTSAYVDDERFKVHGVGIAIDEEPAEYYYNDVIGVLNDIDWDNSILVCHHAHFDGYILYKEYDITPARYFCTMSASKALLQRSIESHSLDGISKALRLGYKPDTLANYKGVVTLTDEQQKDMGDYCKNDIVLTRSLYNVFAPLLPESELELMDFTIRLFCVPQLRLDRPMLEEFLGKETNRTLELIEASGICKTTLSSNKKYAALLESLGLVVPMKISKTTEKETFALSKDDTPYLQLIAENPQHKHIFDGRKAAKSTINVSRAKRLLETSQPLLPVYLHYYGAHTGRWSGGNGANLQNLRRKSDLRKAILAPSDDDVLVVCDLSQIECRLTAWMAGQESMVEDFRNDAPIYEQMGSRIYNIPVEDVTKESHERFVGKTCVLGAGYGMGHRRFKEQCLGYGVLISEKEASLAISTYRRTNPFIPALWKKLDSKLPALLRENGTTFQDLVEFGNEKIILPNGMYLYYPDIGYSEQEQCFGFFDKQMKTFKRLWGGVLCENIIQALARIIIADQILAINKEYPVVMTTHDEIVIAAPERDADNAYAFMKDIMTTPPSWGPDIPLNADGGYAENYSK